MIYFYNKIICVQFEKHDDAENPCHEQYNLKMVDNNNQILNQLSRDYIW